MARVFQYVRPVNAVLTSIDIDNKTYPSEDGVKIKEEPPDFDDLNILLTDVDTAAQNVSAKPVRRRSNAVNIESNECNLIRKPVGSDKNNSDTSRKKRKRKKNDDLELQCVQRKRRRRTRALEIKDTPSKDSTDELVTLNSKQEVLCDVCFVPFFSKKKLIHHTQRYRTLMLCEYCSAPFNLRATLYRHQLVHFRKYGPAPRAKLECYLCERRFDSKERVQMHLFHCHGNVMQSHGCDPNESETSTRTEDTEVRVTSDADKNGVNTRTEILAITNVEEPVKNVCLEDTLVLADSDANKLDENTDMVEIMDIIGVSKNVEENTPTDNSRNCVPDNADKIEENISTGDNTIPVIDDVGRIERNTSINSSVDSVVGDVGRIEKNTTISSSVDSVIGDVGRINGNLYTNDIMDIVGVSKDIMNFDSVTNNVNKNTPIEEITNRESNGADKLEENAEVTEIAILRTNDLDKVEKQESVKRHSRCRSAKKVVNRIEESTSTNRVPENDSTTLTSITLTRSETWSPTKKKMRQTTLTEFLSFSGKNLKQNGIKTEKVDRTEARSSVSDQNATRWKPVSASTPLPNSIVRGTAVNTPTNRTPLLRMHMNPDSIIDLLTDQIKHEPLDVYDSNVSQNSPYNLRRTKPDSYRSSPNLHGTISSHAMSTKRRSRSTTRSKRTPKPKITLLEKLKTKYKCRDCIVLLERCDYTSKRVIFKTDMSKTTIPLQLTINRTADKDSLNSKQTKSSSPTIRIVKLDNCIVVEVMEPR